MLIGHPRQKVYLAVGATDLRKSVDGLAAIVQLDFELSPFEPCLFAFCNRQRNRVKILEWSERGFWLHYFRLEKGRLPWSQEGELYEGSYKKCHNVFDLFRHKTVFDNYRKDYPGKRVVQRCRAGYAGLHRYGVIIQPGDMDSGLDILKDQIHKTLNSAVSGNPFRAPDIGGHFSQLSQRGATVTGTHTYIGGDSRSDEVLIRWFQFCTFSSMMWMHGHPERSKLPWIRGLEVENIFKKFINLRYRMLPYLYTHVWQACTKGKPFMRPLIMDFPEDSHVAKLGTQYMFGNAFLVAPVLEEGVDSWHVYLPEGVWYDFWTGEKVTGGGYHKVCVDLETLPVFVREGAIVPLGPEMQYTSEKPVDPITLLVYPDKDSEFTMYEDDGETYRYLDGEYALTKYACSLKEGKIVVTLGRTEGNYPGMLASRKYVLQVRTEAEPQSVTLDGKALAQEAWRYDGKFTHIELPRIAEEIVELRI
jgi:alpha-D-xyloside xylohydrolase